MKKIEVKLIILNHRQNIDNLINARKNNEKRL